MHFSFLVRSQNPMIPPLIQNHLCSGLKILRALQVTGFRATSYRQKTMIACAILDRQLEKIRTILLQTLESHQRLQNAYKFAKRRNLLPKRNDEIVISHPTLNSPRSSRPFSSLPPRFKPLFYARCVLKLVRIQPADIVT